MEITIEYQPILQAPAACGVKSIKNNKLCKTKPICQTLKMNVTSVKTMIYEQITMNNANKNKPNLPIFCIVLHDFVEFCRIFTLFSPLLSNFYNFLAPYMRICYLLIYILTVIVISLKWAPHFTVPVFFVRDNEVF
jgi:hypothetical protein